MKVDTGWGAVGGKTKHQALGKQRQQNETDVKRISKKPGC